MIWRLLAQHNHNSDFPFWRLQLINIFQYWLFRLSVNKKQKIYSATVFSRKQVSFRTAGTDYWRFASPDCVICVLYRDSSVLPLSYRNCNTWFHVCTPTSFCPQQCEMGSLKQPRGGDNERRNEKSWGLSGYNSVEIPMQSNNFKK